MVAERVEALPERPDLRPIIPHKHEVTLLPLTRHDEARYTASFFVNTASKVDAENFGGWKDSVTVSKRDEWLDFSWNEGETKRRISMGKSEDAKSKGRILIGSYEFNADTNKWDEKRYVTIKALPEMNTFANERRLELEQVLFEKTLDRVIGGISIPVWQYREPILLNV